MSALGNNLQIDPVWITGAGGLIGNALLIAAGDEAHGWNVIGLTRERFDLTNFPQVRQGFRHDKPKVVIHCAALTKTPACQSNPTLARKLNVEVTAFLSELCGDIPFLFFSTDL